MYDKTLVISVRKLIDEKYDIDKIEDQLRQMGCNEEEIKQIFEDAQKYKEEKKNELNTKIFILSLATFLLIMVAAVIVLLF